MALSRCVDDGAKLVVEGVATDGVYVAEFANRLRLTFSAGVTLVSSGERRPRKEGVGFALEVGAGP